MKNAGTDADILVVTEGIECSRFGQHPDVAHKHHVRTPDFLLKRVLHDETYRLAPTRSWRFRSTKLSATTKLDAK